MKQERRTITGTVHARAIGDGMPKEIGGIAAVVNSVTDLGYFEEVITPGAFDYALSREYDIRCLFNHESERRGYEFVTRKITHGIAKIALGLDTHITLGNLEAKRDWGYAPDFVEAAWMMLQQDEPDDYIIATGESKSIRDFLTAAFSHVGITDWERYVKQDERYFRPAEVDVLRGDFSKATNKFGWEPKTPFDTWVGRMVKNDIYLLENR